MGRSGIEDKITAFSAVPAGQNLLITVWNSGLVPSTNKKLLKNQTQTPIGYAESKRKSALPQSRW